MAFSDRELIARLVQCEAGGEGENGMKAVATVIMNRVNSSNRRICKNITRPAALETLYFKKDSLIVQENQ